MIGLLIQSNLDLFYLPSASTLGEVTPILATDKLDELEWRIFNHYDKSGTISEILKVSDKGLLGSAEWTFHPCGVNPLDKLRFIVTQYKDPVLMGNTQDYSFLKGIFLNGGTLNFSKYLEEFSIKYYRVPATKYPNDLSVDCDPFEFLLIQNGLSRIDFYPFESNDLNTESNSDCWKRYLNHRVEIYEIDSLPR